MLNFKRYGVRMRYERPFDELETGSYSQYFIDAEDELDAKIRARQDFGPGWEVSDVFGPFDHLEVRSQA